MKQKSTMQMTGRISVLAVVAAFAIIVAAIAVGAYAWSSRPSSRPAEHLEQVTIATNTEYIGTCSVMVARDKGYFAGEGIRAIVQPYSSGKASMEAVLQGQAELGTVADIPIMFAGLNEQHVSVIATIFKTDRDHGIVGRRDLGVGTPANLKGKRIGVTFSTSGHFTLDAFLNRQLLSPSDVILRNYKPEDLPRALARGEVDAIASWEPFLTTAMKELGNNGIVFRGQDIYESLYSIAGMRDYVTRHPETIKRFLRALDNGTRDCSANPDAARQLVAGSVTRKPDEHGAAQPYHFDVVLDQGLLLALEDEARWAIKNKMTTRTTIPNYLDYVYLNGLEAVKPDAVTIIH